MWLQKHFIFLISLLRVKKKKMNMAMGELWTQLGSGLASVMFVWAMFRQYFPYELVGPLERYGQKFVNLFYPYVQITFHEFRGDGFERSKAYAAIERYLGANSSSHAKRLKADIVRGSKSLVLSIDDHEDTTDDFNGVKVWWSSRKKTSNRQTISWYPELDDKRYYKLTFHRRHRDLISNTYLNHVLEQGKELEVKSRQRKLYTNISGENSGYRRRMWSSVVFEHPATFDTLAMDPKKKQAIINDLITFSESKDYYKKIGKAWKRGYLLYGPPGTGKSTMIAAMANLMEYDVYDLELTAVKDNTQLRKLLIDISSKSIVVIEDIDCSLDLTGQRQKKKEKDEDKDKEEKDPVKKKMKDEEDDKRSKVTLSGLLNFIDGLWSACGGERLIIFTTNYVEKLDPALIRRGRMDKRIELSYCGVEAFKVLAKNYLDLDSHPLFETVEKLLGETDMSPADVAENLMPKSAEEDAEVCLKNLIAAFDTAKEEARLKAEAEEEDKLKAEKEEKEKEQSAAAAADAEKAKENGIAADAEKVKENGIADYDKKVKENGVVDVVKENGDISKK